MCLLEYYEETLDDNDLLQLTYIVSKNVKEIKFNSRQDPIVIPSTPRNDLYRSVVSSFINYLDFYSNVVEEGEYKQVIAYYKLKHSCMSYFQQYDNYLKSKLYKDTKDSLFYNEEFMDTLLNVNEFVTHENRNACFGPLYLAIFFRQHGNRTMYKNLKREAMKMAELYERTADFAKILKRSKSKKS